MRLVRGAVFLAWGLLAGGCVPSAAIDARHLSDAPVPAGRMAVLPPVLLGDVQDATLAESFVRQIVVRMKAAGLDAVYGDLGGRLAASAAATQSASAPASQPGAAAPAPWMNLPAAQRAQLLAGTGFATVCQPVVARYGHYPVYVPPEVYVSRAGPPPLARGRVIVVRGGGDPWWDGPSRTYVPAHYEPAGQIVLSLHLFDARTGERVYYVLASSASTDYRPGELEKGFYKPLNKTFAKALGVKRNG